MHAWRVGVHARPRRARARGALLTLAATFLGALALVTLAATLSLPIVTWIDSTAAAGAAGFWALGACALGVGRGGEEGLDE